MFRHRMRLLTYYYNMLLLSYMREIVYTNAYAVSHWPTANVFSTKIASEAGLYGMFATLCRQYALIT